MAIRRGTDVRPELRDIAGRTAHRMAGMKAFVWVFVALAVVEVVNGLLLQDGTARWLSVLVGVLFLVAAVSYALQVKRAREAVRRFG